MLASTGASFTVSSTPLAKNMPRSSLSGKKCIVLVSVNVFSVEIIFVIYEIDLHPGCGNGRHLNDEWPVNLSYDNIHP
jgi:hypothetical protein